jgi:hypothetical protein
MPARDDQETERIPPGRWEGTAYGSGASITGYGQTAQPCSGYGHTKPSPDAGVSYAGSTGYAGYAGHTISAGTATPPVPAPGGPPTDWLDMDYQQWRDEQLRKLDHDYRTWRQARYRRFADEFDAWRSSRQDHRASGPTGGTPSGAPPLPPSHPSNQELS